MFSLAGQRCYGAAEFCTIHEVQLTVVDSDQWSSVYLSLFLSLFLSYGLLHNTPCL
jgi:hypothetical protein